MAVAEVVRFGLKDDIYMWVLCNAVVSYAGWVDGINLFDREA